MPASSIFKSKPKTDRRLQWKALKAKHAKTLTAKKIKVEIGLGKALDKYQKQVNALVKLDASQVNQAAFGPVVASAAEVTRLATNLQPVVKGLTEFTVFLTGLKQDCGWWAKAAQQIEQQPGYMDRFDTERLTEAINGVNQLKGPVKNLDALLVKALKKTKTYTPPFDVITWNKHSQALRPYLAKYELLSKKPTANAKLLIGVMRDMEPMLSDMRTKALHMTTIAKDNHPAVVDWKAVEAAAKVVLDKAFEARSAVGRLR